MLDQTYGDLGAKRCLITTLKRAVHDILSVSEHFNNMSSHGKL